VAQDEAGLFTKQKPSIRPCSTQLTTEAQSTHGPGAGHFFKTDPGSCAYGSEEPFTTRSRLLFRMGDEVRNLARTNLPVMILDFCPVPVPAIELEDIFRQAIKVRSPQEFHLDDNIQTRLEC
jgi:hypothetical protein